MASQSAGIQQLLQAEKFAAEKVAEARKRKTKRLKQAKEEAQAEILKFRQEREHQFREHEAKVLGSRTDTQAQIEQETVGKIHEINQTVVANQDECIKNILAMVGEIKPEVHKNFRTN